MANYDAESGLLNSAGMMVNYLYEVAPETVTIAAPVAPMTVTTGEPSIPPSTSSAINMQDNRINSNDENIIYLRQHDLASRIDIIQESIQGVFAIPKGRQVMDILNEK
jgi:hypothetical protein